MAQIKIGTTPISGLTVSANALSQGLLQNKALKERRAKMRAEQEQREFDKAAKAADIENEKERIRQSGQIQRQQMKAVQQRYEQDIELAERRYEQDAELAERREERMTREGEARIGLGRAREARERLELRQKGVAATQKREREISEAKRAGMISRRLGGLKADAERMEDTVQHYTRQRLKFLTASLDDLTTWGLTEEEARIQLAQANRNLRVARERLRLIYRDQAELEQALKMPAMKPLAFMTEAAGYMGPGIIVDATGSVVGPKKR